jgi:hypothetical protein
MGPRIAIASDYNPRGVPTPISRVAESELSICRGIELLAAVQRRGSLPLLCSIVSVPDTENT